LSISTAGSRQGLMSFRFPFLDSAPIRGKIHGCARGSTEAQDLTGAKTQLKAAGCRKIYRKKIIGTTADRPRLKKLVAALAHGDVVIVQAVDRLLRTTDHLNVARDLLASVHWPSLSLTRHQASPRSLRNPPHCREARTLSHQGAPGARRYRREGEGRDIWVQAEAHAAPAARFHPATLFGGQNAALDGPQPQCQRADDFEAVSICGGFHFRSGTR
jgi:hypothetical protein